MKNPIITVHFLKKNRAKREGGYGLRGILDSCKTESVGNKCEKKGPKKVYIFSKRGSFLGCFLRCFFGHF